MADSFAYDVFLSHNSQDKPRVRKLAKRLRKAGLRVWFDEWVIKPGDDIYLAIERGLEKARVQVLCLSPAAMGSEWVTLERSTVLFRDPTNKGRRFVPLLLADCTLPDTLRRYKYVDFRQETPAVVDELLAACRVEVEAMPPAPPESKKEPAEPKPRPAKPPEQAEPRVVLERKLTGHTNHVGGIAVSPDGKWAASGSDDSTIRVWDLESGICVQTLGVERTDKLLPPYIRSVAITPDGERIVAALYDTRVVIWRRNEPGVPIECKGHENVVWSVKLVRRGIWALSASYDQTLRLWDVATGKHLRTLTGSDDSIYSLAVTSDGKRAISGQYNGKLRVWDLETDACLKELCGHSDDIVDSVEITVDGRFAVSGSNDRTIKVWDLEAGTCVGTLEGHQDSVQCVAISPDSTLIASAGCTDATVRLWDFKSGACLQVITRESADFNPVSVAFSPDGSRLLAGSTGGEIRVFRLCGVRAAPTAEGTRRYVNAKVLLLGEGAVGKTSLAHRLIEDKYVVRDRTHGMNVWKLPLPHAPDATADREALLWDLAGQEDYRLIHQLFLEETALALLLINPQKADPFAEVGDWLKASKTASQCAQRDVAKLLVFSQIDVGGMKISNAKIERFLQEHRFAGWLATSAKSGENCSDGAEGGRPSKLKQLIADNIPWNTLPWTAVHPPILAELKNTVLRMRDRVDIRLLRFAELTQRLEQALPGTRVSESDVRTAVTLLSNQGLAWPLKFGDLVLLQPELLNGYGGAIIRAARAHTDEIGCVSEADIYAPGFDFTGVDRLPRPDEELLLRAMVQTFLDHSLCISEETPQGRHLVFPSQYRREKDIPRDPDIFVSYTFGGEWQTVWTTLVVRLWYSQEFEHKELWRNAAEFVSPKKDTLGLKLTHKQGEGEATIALYFDKGVPDELKALFIEYVHRHLAKYACDVTRDRRYVCPECGKPVRDIEAVRRRKEAGKEFINCQECDDVKVPFIDFIEQRLKSDPVARRILAMDATATRGLDVQALEQILIGHMLAICGEANQIFRPVTMADYGIDGEVEFRDNNGKASGKKIYVQLKSGDSYMRLRKTDGKEVFDVQNERHLGYWVSQPVDVYLVIRQTDEVSGGSSIRWMNLTRCLKTRKDKQSRQIIFEGEPLTMEAVWKKRDELFPPRRGKTR